MSFKKWLNNTIVTCGANDAVEIKCLRTYTNNQKIHVCKHCGFVYVKERRTAIEVANEYEEILKNKSTKIIIPQEFLQSRLDKFLLQI